MIRLWFLLLTLVLTPACGKRAHLPEEELLLRVEVGVDKVQFGCAFPLTVTRVWSKELRPQEWRGTNLRPLIVRLIEKERREDARRVEEVLRYQVWAFTLKNVVLPELSFKAFPKGGGPPRVARVGAFSLPVVTALDPTRPGAAEMPGTLLARPLSWLAWVGGGAAVLVLGLLLWYLARRKRSVQAPETHVDPFDRALARLRRLQGQVIRSDEEIQSFYVEALAALRDYLEDRFSVCSPQMTTDEFLASPRTGKVFPLERKLLAGFMGECDLVKFGRQSSTVADRERLLAGMEGFVLQEVRG